ncbi:hypothetical protein RYX36_037071, partial [Vicia faba]
MKEMSKPIYRRSSNSTSTLTNGGRDSEVFSVVGDANACVVAVEIRDDDVKIEEDIVKTVVVAEVEGLLID